jgi:uncharacterized protein YgfB (UPF0149 family)
MENLSEQQWSTVGEALRRAGSMGEPSEIHGEFCGLACVMGEDAIAPWIEGALSDTDSSREDAAATLHSLGAATWSALEAGDMSFVLLLPLDDDRLAQRVDCLSHWCQGFMHGLGGAGPSGKDSPVVRDGVTRDIISDFNEITRAAFGEDETEEEGEAAYIELVEYVRVSAQLVFEELHGLRGGGDKAGTH